MTLADLLPSLRTSLRPHFDAAVWPTTARLGARGDLLAGGVPMTTLVRTHGAPVHVLDEHDVRARCAEYVHAFGAGAVAYSAKAGLTVEAGRWIADAGLGCYVSSAAQLRTALLAGFPPGRLVLHGSAKSVTDLDAAYACGAAIVVGSTAEVERVAARAPQGQRVLVRVVPAAAARGRIRYGLRLGARPALTAIEAIDASGNLVLAGLDCSLGHQLSRFHVFEACLREAMAFCAVVRARCGVEVSALNLGGGHAVAYSCADDGFAISAFASRARAMLRLCAERYDIAQPRLTVSPGRSIVARAGLTLARVATVATTADGGIRATLDGVTGCATYSPCAGKHEVQLIGRVSPAGSRPASVAGSLGGSRTAPVSATRLPADLTVGDLLAVAGTGAYHHVDDAGLGGLPVLGVADGQVRTLRRRATFDDMLRSVA